MELPGRPGGDDLLHGTAEFFQERHHLPDLPADGLRGGDARDPTCGLVPFRDDAVIVHRDKHGGHGIDDVLQVDPHLRHLFLDEALLRDVLEDQDDPDDGALVVDDGGPAGGYGTARPVFVMRVVLPVGSEPILVRAPVHRFSTAVPASSSMTRKIPAMELPMTLPAYSLSTSAEWS
jgi:hypothetical protein